jgi:hypothetical protein
VSFTTVSTDDEVPGWVDDLDEIDDDRLLDLLDQHADATGEISDGLWLRVGPRVRAIHTRQRLEGWKTREQKITALLRSVGGNPGQVTDEDLVALDLVHQEVEDYRLDLAEWQRWLREERQRQIGE